jgi:glycosyltransferase involved in cell wall biosynthesis
MGRDLGVGVLLPGSRRNAAALLSAFDVLAAPTPDEVFGLAIAEAMAARIPLAAVDSPGARMLTLGATLAPLCPPTGAGLAARITAALEEREDVRTRRADQVLASFGADAVSARAQAYFEQAVSRLR